MIQRALNSTLAAVITFAIICLQAFTSKAGTDVFEIYLNNKLILRQAVTQGFTLQSLQLNKANKNDQLVIFYNHCGAIGKSRAIAIKDDKGNTIKEWKFADATGADRGMTIPVSELLQLQKNYSQTNINLVYSSRQLPQGRAISVLQFNGKSTSWRPARELWPLLAVGFSME